MKKIIMGIQELILEAMYITTPNPPSNPYCEAILTATDEKGDEYAVWKGTLRDAK